MNQSDSGSRIALLDNQRISLEYRLIYNMYKPKNASQDIFVICNDFDVSYTTFNHHPNNWNN